MGLLRKMLKGRHVVMVTITLSLAVAGHARVFGVDERELPQAYSFSAVETSEFSGIGRVECPLPGGGSMFGTVFNAGSFRVVVTTAHSFYDKATGKSVDPRTCRVNFYNSVGMLQESLGIERVSSRWDDPALREDVSNDIAIVRLTGIVQTASRRSPLTIPERSTPIGVTMVGFHSTAKNPKRLGKVVGILHPLQSMTVLNISAKKKNNSVVRNPENIMLADYDSTFGTSGAPVYNSEMKIVGIDQGYAGNQSTKFDPVWSFNIVLTFDERFRRDLETMIALK